MNARAHRSFYRRVNQTETIDRLGFRACHKRLKQIGLQLLLERLLSDMSEKEDVRMRSHVWRVPLLLTFLGTLVPAVAVVAQPPQAGFGFNGIVSGFPTGTVSVTGGGAYGLASNFVHAAGGFSCIETVNQGPLSISINPDDPGPCLAGQGVRWDTASLLPSTTFKCTGAATETLKTATTNDRTVVLQADFYRAGDANDESFTAQMIVSATDIAPEIGGLQNLWIQGVGCGTAIVNFSNK
jgi:hypothetical protein